MLAVMEELCVYSSVLAANYKSHVCGLCEGGKAVVCADLLPIRPVSWTDL